MTTPSPAAVDAARKFVKHDDREWTLCGSFSVSDDDKPDACTCDYDARIAELAAAFDAYGSRARRDCLEEIAREFDAAASVDPEGPGSWRYRMLADLVRSKQ